MNIIFLMKTQSYFACSGSEEICLAGVYFFVMILIRFQNIVAIDFENKPLLP